MTQQRTMESAFYIRMPTPLREALKARAYENRRSMNSEAVLHLERGLTAEKKAPGQP